MSQYTKFVADLECMNIHVDENRLSTQDRLAIGSVYGNVKEFMQETNLVPGEMFSSLESFEQPIRTLNSTVSLSELGPDRLIELVQKCGIDKDQVRSCVESLALCLQNYTNNYNAAAHFNRSAPSSSHDGLEVRGLDTMYSTMAIERHTTANPVSSLESFGTDIGNTISDAKVAIAVSILRYHRGILRRLIPNIPTDTNMVSFKVDHMEVYDLTKSRSDSSAVRYEDRHRIPFVDLYSNPSPANTKLKPIVLRTANDGTGPAAKLLAENVVKIGVGLNMFDYALDAGQIGYQHVDYTDLVADNVRIKALYVQVSDGTNSEILPITVTDVSGARMLMSANNMDSADRICSLNDITVLDATSKQMGGAATSLLAGLSTDGVIRFKYSAAGQINLKSSELVIHGGGSATIATKSTNPVIANDKTLFDSLIFTLIGYEPAADFSEENVRKTTKAMRVMTKEVAYEIPGSTNYMVQYSLTQTKPEVVIDALTKVMALGNDDRGVKLLMDTLANVRDRVTAEKALGADNYINKIGQSFVAGQRVKPYVFMDTLIIDTAIKNLRTGDKWGDLRAVAEEYLLNIFSRMYRESFYTQELAPGEKPVFSVLTSIPIKDSLLSVPHYHDHLADNAADKVADGVVEFRRTLPDGTVMNVITTTFDYFDDKMLIVPVRPGRPQSVLNFASNRERGTWLAQATPTIDNAIFNALIGNSREFPIIQNPVGALVTVSNLHQIFDGLASL